MKKIFFAILFSFLFIFLPAQNAFTFGKKYGWMNHLNNINRTVYSYNYARTWLTQKMPYFKAMNGYELSWQHRGEIIGYEVLYSKMKEVNDAFGLEPTGGLTGYRKITIGMFGLSAGITAKIFEKKHIEIMPSFDFDFHALFGQTMYSNEATFAGASPEAVIGQIKMANTFGMNITLFATQWLGINIRPYYQLPWGKANVEGLAAYWGGSGTGAQRERIRNYGISASLILEFGRDDLNW
jgi:hypothetical protein